MNGIASYANQEMVPPGAIANIRGAADMLERFGREGDIYVVHAAEGETVVPMEVLDSSPSLKKMLFSQMEEMGLKPERYVVGNELNSLNPVTGKPEFFFKKLFNSIKGIFKKAAPILGAIAGSFIAPGIGTAFGAALGGSATALAIGSVAGSALASGIGSFAASKLTGASTRDALKGAAFSAGTAGLFKGFSMTDFGSELTSGNIAEELFPETFGSFEKTQNNFVNNLMGSSAVSEPGTLSLNPPTTNVSQSVAPSVRSLNPTASVPADTLLTSEQISQQLDLDQATKMEDLLRSFRPKYQESFSTIPDMGPIQVAKPEIPTFMRNVDVGNNLNRVGLDRLPSVTTGTNISGVSGVDSFGNVAVPPGTGVNASEFSMLPDMGSASSSLLSGLPNVVRDAAGNVVDFVKENPGTSLFAAGLAGSNLYDAYMTNKEIEKEAEERTRTNNRFATAYDLAARGRGPINLGQNPGIAYPTRPMLVKKGGEIPSKGLGDIVPAMLEPGEFVMTRSAVTGAGNGSQKDGIKRMYSMMKDFEGRV